MKLNVQDIRFSYNGHPVLSEVSFAIEPGQILCVLGINGAGKSTLLKCLNGILKPQRGSVLIDGEDMLHMDRNSVARKMGYVPQSHKETGLTVFEAVLTGRRPHIRWALSSKDYAVVEKIMGRIGIEHLAMRSIGDLSGGETQKVFIARALAQSPEILLLDEPTSNLDLSNQLEVMGLVRRIVEKERLSAVVAIHDLNIALRFADNLLFLKENRIHAVSSREDLTADTIGQVYGVDVEFVKVGDHTVVAPL
jgi:iron complex transport system ATP-binding protein